MDFKLHVPVGVKDFLPQDYRYKNEIEKRIENVFCKYGYQQLSSPMFEHIQVFENKGGTPTDRMVQFLDREGRLLALRSEMTLPIARIVSTNFDPKGIPYRFSYIGNSFRYNETFQGKQREFTQAGVELIGINAAAADAEVLAIAIHSLLNTGLTDFKISLGHVGFLNGILEEISLIEEDKNTLRMAILNKDFVALEKFIKEKEMPTEIKNILDELQFLVGGLPILEEAAYPNLNHRAHQALQELRQLHFILDQYGLAEYITFDLSTIGNFDYYTGIIFSAYTHGIGFTVLDGGRYDNLLKKFGTDLPAVGFAIKINDMMDALQYQKVKYPTEMVETLVMYSEEGQGQALKTADELRNQGVMIENSLLGSDIEKNKKYAQEKKIGGILYFKDSSEVIVMDLNSGEETIVRIEDLLKS